MKKLVVAAAAAASVIVASAPAQAAGGFAGPACTQPGPFGGGAFGRLFAQPAPAFQAAPWYLYWPYNAHFMTPAPLMGAYAAPPTGPLANPYFPGHGYGR